MLATEHTRAAQQARTHIQLAAELLGQPVRKGYEGADRFSLSPKEFKEYSLARVLRALSDPMRYGHDASLERTVSYRALKAGVARQGAGYFVPFEILQRDLSVGTASAGGNLAGGSITDAAAWLRPASAAVSAGATFLSGLNDAINVPRFASGITAGVVGESQPGAKSDPSFAALHLTPKTITAHLDWSRRLGQQANEDISNMLSADLAAAVGTVIDQMAINGSGTSSKPLGILNTPNIGDVAIGANGGAATWDKIVDLEYSVAAENAAIGALGFVTTPKVQKQLKKTEAFAGAGVPIWGRNSVGDSIGGTPAWASNNVPSTLTKGSSANCSALIFGNWVDLIVGIWGGGVEVLVDKVTNVLSGGTRLVVFIDADVGVRRPTSFGAIKDIVAP